MDDDTTLIMDDLDAIEARYQATLSGPWEYSADDAEVLSVRWQTHIADVRDRPTGEFIAQAPTDIANLLHDIRLYLKMLEKAYEEGFRKWGWKGR